MIETLKLALEALNKNVGELRIAGARHILRTAIEQAEKQEPVAWMDEFGNVFPLGAQRGPKYLNEPMKPLYTTSPAAQRQPLTDEQISDIAINNPPIVHVFARAIEAAHGIGENK